MSIHVIRLRGPWEAQALDPGSPSHRITFPCRWKDLAGAASSQTLLLRRKFHAPSNLSATDQVWLCLESTGSQLLVFFNNRPLSPASDANSWELTRFLLASNTLELSVLGSAEMEALAIEARLEIRSRDAES